MERWQLITGVVLAYLVVTLVIGIVAGRRATRGVTGYVAADRQFGLLAMYFVIGASVFSAFAFLGGPGWAYSRGMAVLYILSYGVIGLAPWYFIGPRSARLGRARGYVTQAQLVTGRFPSRSLSALMAAIAIIAFIPYVMLQMSGAGIVFEAVTQGNIPFWAGAALAYGVVVLYVLLGGASAVGWTNVFEGVLMVVVAWILGLWLPYELYGGIGPMFDQIAAARPELLTVPGLDSAGNPWTWTAYSTAFLSSAIGLCMWPHLFMKAFAARDDRTLRRTVVLYPTFQLFLIPLILVGFAGVLFSSHPENPDFILPHVLLNTDMPFIMVGLFCAGALAASMSTGDALLHGAASIAVEDAIAPFVRFSEYAQRRLIQILVVVIGLVAYYFAIVMQPNLVLLLLTAYAFIDQLAPPVYAALYWKRATTAGVLSGLFGGMATAVLFVLRPGLRPLGIHEGILGLVVNVALLVTVSHMTRPQNDEHASGFLAIARGPRKKAPDRLTIQDPRT
jgi:SSS family solute:Na+ symporter